MRNQDEKKVVQQMIRSGDIKQLQDIFRYAQITPVIKHLNTNHSRLQLAIADVSRFRVATLVQIAEYFEIDEKIMLDLVANQLLAAKKKKRK